MKVVTRWGILFVFALLSIRIGSGFSVTTYWYSFSWALLIGALNALIRPILLGLNARCTWFQITIMAIVLNLLLYSVTFLGGFTWLGLTVSTYGGALVAGGVETVASVISNHFIGFKGPGGGIDEVD